MGSSLHWLFVIIPMVDYTPDIGPLLVSPGSHRFTTLLPGGRVTRVRRARADQLAPFVDPGLERGNVLFMHGFMWHQASSNQSNQLRYGLYNKYMAADAPPGCGPYLFTTDAQRAFTARGSQLLENAADERLAETRLMVERGGRALLLRSADSAWTLSGGPAQTERKRPGADSDNVIEHLEGGLARALGGTPPWVSYVDDFSVDSGLCRVYAYPDNGASWLGELAARGKGEWSWFDPDELAREVAGGGVADAFAAAALQSWLTAKLRRGVGQSAATALAKPA